MVQTRHLVEEEEEVVIMGIRTVIRMAADIEGVVSVDIGGEDVVVVMARGLVSIPFCVCTLH